jgi:hypothetical protein
LRTDLLVLVLVVIASSNNPRSSAQQNSKQSCDVPLVITRYVPSSRTVELVRDLGAKDLTVQLGGSPGTLESALVDSGPRRLALILDASRNVPNDEWTLETEMAASLVSHARPEDRFAFLLIGGDATASLLLSANEVEDRLQKLASSRPLAADASEKIYDSLLAAADRFNPPEFGDTIFLFGHPEDSGSSANVDQVSDVSLEKQVALLRDEFRRSAARQTPSGF